MTIRRRTFEIVEVAGKGDRASALFDYFMITLILANVFAFILSTEPAIHDQAPRAFYLFELVSVIIFTIEYALRLWTAVEKPHYHDPITGRIRFALRPMMIIDFLAVAPFYLPFVGVDLRVLRVLRVVRIIRILKLARYSSALTLIFTVLRKKRAELVVTTSLLLILLLIASSLMYFAERDAQPETFGSVPRAMWWGVVTLTTVGYGDVYPVTAVGRILGAIIAILGIGMFALPTAIIGTGFVDEVGERRKQESGDTCPTCGRPNLESSDSSDSVNSESSS